MKATPITKLQSGILSDGSTLDTRLTIPRPDASVIVDVCKVVAAGGFGYASHSLGS